MTLRLSRHQFAYWCVKQDQATWCQAHIAALAFCREVPRRIIFDNLKDGVVKPDLYDPVTYRDLPTIVGSWSIRAASPDRRILAGRTGASAQVARPPPEHSTPGGPRSSATDGRRPPPAGDHRDHQGRPPSPRLGSDHDRGTAVGRPTLTYTIDHEQLMHWGQTLALPAAL